MKFPRIFTLITLLALAFAACEGPIGPQGPPGFDGFDGLDGVQASSIQYEVIASDWQDIGQPGEDGFFRALDLSVPEITQNIEESGLVLAYYRALDEDPWTFLPLTFVSHNPDFTEVFDFVYETGFVTLLSSSTDRDGTPYEGTVRIIVAPGVPVTKTAINYHNYEEVKEIFGLKD
ncbi:MAG: hypothetical protein AAF694_19930 [Bacteroidota bacterium]